MILKLLKHFALLLVYLNKSKKTYSKLDNTNNQFTIDSYYYDNDARLLTILLQNDELCDLNESLKRIYNGAAAIIFKMHKLKLQKLLLIAQSAK